MDFDIDRVGLYLTNCIKLLTQAAWGHLGLHYAKKTSGKEPKLADPYGGSTSLISSLNTNALRILLVQIERSARLDETDPWALAVLPAKKMIQKWFRT